MTRSDFRLEPLNAGNTVDAIFSLDVTGLDSVS